MPTYTITLTDTEDAGVTAARAAYNANPSNFDPTTGAPITYSDNATYIVFVMTRAADGYDVMYQVPPTS